MGNLTDRHPPSHSSHEMVSAMACTPSRLRTQSLSDVVMQVCFHPATRAIVLLIKFQTQLWTLSWRQRFSFVRTFHTFPLKNVTFVWLSNLDVISDEYFISRSGWPVLAKSFVTNAFVNRKVFKIHHLFTRRPRPTSQPWDTSWRNRAGSRLPLLSARTLTSLMISIVPNLKTTDTDWIYKNGSW